MNIITVYFENDEAPKDFEKVLDIYEYSAKKYMSNSNVKIHKFNKPTRDYFSSIKESQWLHENEYMKFPNWYTSNLYKLDRWVEILSTVTDNTIITDCDIFFTDDISYVFEEDFDIAYTKRTDYDKLYCDIYRKPINGGVFFFKPTQKSKEFIKKWKEINWRMALDEIFYNEWQLRYSGCNQTAFGYLLENDTETNIKELPCAIYNGCAIDLIKYKERVLPKVVHIKRPIWQIAASDYHIDELPNIPDHDSFTIPEYRDIIQLWRDLYNERILLGSKL